MRNTSNGSLWMQVVTFLWFISTFAVFPGNAFLLYPMAAVFLVVLFFERDKIAPILSRCWFLFLIPIMGLISATWSGYPADAIRLSLFYFLSALSVVIIGSLLTERQILRAFFFCALAGTALAITELGAIIATGKSEYLGQKNFFAMKMMIGMIAGFAVAMNREENPVMRLLGLALIPIDLFLVLSADSATSMVLSILSLLLLILAQLFWVNTRSVKGLRTFIAGFGVLAAAAAILLAMGMANSSVMNKALGAVGKDSTFTGRTALWNQAEITSAEHPVLGVGMAGFWQYDVGAAQTLAENDSKDPGTKLGFHNAYLEAQVHLGYVGLGLFLLALIISLWKVTRSFLVVGTFERVCFFVAALIMFTMTFTESLLFGFFHPGVYIFNLAVITAIASSYNERKVYLNLIPEEDAPPVVAMA